MRALIIADIHANFDALRALPRADFIICAGDVVTFGAEPAACIDWLLSTEAICVRGDEDDAVAHGTDYPLPAHLSRAGAECRRWTRTMLSPKQIAWLSALPPEMEVPFDGARIGVVHGYPGDYNRYLKPTPEELDRLTRAFPRADLIVLGHTHRAGVWQHRGKLVVNPGSVGQSAHPGKASYALYERGRITLGLAPYMLDRAVAKLGYSSLDPGAQVACIHELQRGSVRPDDRLGPITRTVPA